MVVAMAGVLMEVQTKLAEGPPIHPGPVEVPTGCAHRIVILWRELPQRVAAVLAIIGGVLWLLVSPTAPSAAAHATQLVREAAGIYTVQQAPEPEPLPIPRPRKGKRPPVETERMVARREVDQPATGDPH